MATHYNNDCPICGCHGTLATWQDEHGYLHTECAVCEGCKSIRDIAIRFKMHDVMKQLYLYGLREEYEQVEVVADKLAENKNIPTIDLDRLAEEIVDEMFLDVQLEAESELNEGLEEYREMLDAVRGSY